MDAIKTKQQLARDLLFPKSTSNLLLPKIKNLHKQRLMKYSLVDVGYGDSVGATSNNSGA